MIQLMYRRRLGNFGKSVPSGKVCRPCIVYYALFSIDNAGVVLLDNVILQSVVCSYNVNRADRVVQTCLYNVNHTGDVVQCVKCVVQSACVLR